MDFSVVTESMCWAEVSMANESNQWSQQVSRTSDALDLEPGVFTWTDPAEIARSLKRSAERSNRRKSDPFRSAMSMLSFYINRAGGKLDPTQRQRLEAAKDELRSLYDRPRRQP
jgi:hypothetical protein